MNIVSELGSIKFSRSQGVDVELRHILPENWTVEFQDDSYIVRVPEMEGWKREMWRIVEFLSYDALAVLRRIDPSSESRRYEFISASKSGLAFRMLFLLTQ